MDRKVVNLIFGISLMVLFLLSVFTFSRLSEFKSYATVVDHSNQVLNCIVNLRSGFKSLMATQRSFLITKKPTYYTEFQVEKDSVRHTVDYFKKLTAESKIQQYYISNLEKDINNRIRGLMVEMINDTSTARYKYVQNDLIERNSQINTDFNETLNRMHAYELGQMKLKLKDKQVAEKVTPFLLLITSLLAIGIISYSFFLLSAELEKRFSVQKLLEENIEKLNKSNSELEQYAYVASHDLQEPLRKIRTFSNVLLKKHALELSPEATDIIKRVDKSSERMTRLINDLLSLSRLLSNKNELVPVDLNLVLNEVLIEFEEKINDMNVEIDTVQLPTVMGSEGQLYQLFQNLISNALKFSRVGVRPTIKFRTTIISKWIDDIEHKFYQVMIIDNGSGFSNEYLNKMFSVFGRLETTRHVEGTGIGLSICNRIMQNHEGEITAEGIPDKMAQFNLFFPLT